MSIFPSYIIKSPDGSAAYYNQTDYIKKMVEYSRLAVKSKNFISWCKSRGILNPVSTNTVDNENNETVKVTGTKELYLKEYLTECGFKFEEV